MKMSRAMSLAGAFLIDNFLIYLVANLLATFLNPYDNSFQNRYNFMIIYVATLVVYITFSESKYKTTLGGKILNIK